MMISPPLGMWESICVVVWLVQATDPTAVATNTAASEIPALPDSAAQVFLLTPTQPTSRREATVRLRERLRAAVRENMVDWNAFL
jgi:hypothetical protein